jgi:hypothetical protein
MDVLPGGHDQDRSIITVTGDIDLGTAENLLVRLTAVLAASPTAVGGPDYVATRRTTTPERTAGPRRDRLAA